MSGSYARGDQPRSVADPDAAAYAEMIARQRRLNALQAAADEQRATAARAPEPPSGAVREKDYWRTHPGIAESFVPVWGSAREGIADAYERDVIGALGNGVLALSDFVPGSFFVKGLAKGGLKLGGSHTWSATRKWMGKRGTLDAGQHGHHGMIPQGGWGRHVPDWFKNQPPNITAMPSPEVHGRIHGRYAKKPQYDLIQRYWRGTPDGAKSALALLASRSATAADSSGERQ